MATSSWTEVDPQAPEQAHVDEAVAILRAGGLAVLPTDTGYALCGDALDDAVLARVFASKSRDPGKPISVMVANLRHAQELVMVEPRVERVFKALLPGPLTLVLPRVLIGYDSLNRYGTTLGVRIPDLSFTLSVLERLGRPLTATSANPSGGPSPHRRSQLGSCAALPGVEAIFDAGDLPHGRASTIVEILPGRQPVLLREGPVDLSEVLAVL